MYARNIAALALHFKCLPLNLHSEQIQDYLFELQQRSKTPSQTFFKFTIYGLRFLLKTEGLPYSFLNLPPIKTIKKLPVVLSKEEVWRMLKGAKLLKHRILIGLLYGCGLRCGEVRNIRLRDLDFDRKQLHVVLGKGKMDRYLPLSKHLIRGIKTFIKKTKPKDWLFNGQSSRKFGGDFDSRYSQRGIQWVIQSLCKKVGILKDVHVHTLRHTYATHLIEDGLDIISVKELLGHIRLETTLVYLHICQLDKERVFSPLDTLFEKFTDL
ncbi:MAG: tyrosine-type recombinase/integrase [Ferruginibacter sp.]